MPPPPRGGIGESQCSRGRSRNEASSVSRQEDERCPGREQRGEGEEEEEEEDRAAPAGNEVSEANGDGESGRKVWGAIYGAEQVQHWLLLFTLSFFFHKL